MFLEIGWYKHLFGQNGTEKKMLRKEQENKNSVRRKTILQIQIAYENISTSEDKKKKKYDHHCIKIEIVQG